MVLNTYVMHKVSVLFVRVALTSDYSYLGCQGYVLLVFELIVPAENSCLS